jgi:hypothetical protein
MENQSTEQSNVIEVIFDPEFYNQLYMLIKNGGHVKAEKVLLEQGHHPTFVKCAIKRIFKTRGW